MGYLLDTDVVGLGRYWSTIRRRRWIVLGFVLVFAVGMMGYVEARPGKFQATAQVLLKPYSTSKFSEVPLTTAQVDTQVQVMESLTIVGPVAARLHPPETAASLQKSISTKSVGDTSVIEVTVARDNAKQAADIANALAERYLQFRRNDLPPSARGSNFATVVSGAQPPHLRSGPSLLVGGLLGIVIGLVIGCAVALVVERRDHSVTDEAAINELTGGVPVLGRIPVVRRKSRRPVLAESRTSRESIAYSFLATTVRLVRRDRQAHAVAPLPTFVLVVSAAPRDGRTSVAANMAFAAGEAGQQVVLCDADLTQPSLTRLLGLHQQEITLETLLRRPLTLGIDLMAHPAPQVHALGTAGAFAGQSALLADGGFAALVERLPKTVDLVIVDTSPLLSSADVLELVEQADVVLLVVRERFSKKPDIASALERIRQVGGDVAGVVVTGSYTSLGTQRTTRRRATPAIVASSRPEPDVADSTSATNVSNR